MPDPPINDGLMDSNDVATPQQARDPSTQRMGQSGQHHGMDNFEIETARTVKLPPFWKENPALWFAQIEAAFVIARITGDETRFRYTIVNLDQSTLPFVSDILASPPAQGRYETLKARLIASFGETTESKLRRLLRGQEFTDEKPSNVLQRLRNLAQGQCNDSVLGTIFIEHLPENVRTILAISETTDLNKLAAQADKILEVSRPNLATITANQVTQVAAGNELRDLKQAIEELTRETARMRFRGEHRNAQEERPRSLSRARRRRLDLCFYHRRFGEKARNCEDPCAWKKENSKKTENTPVCGEAATDHKGQPNRLIVRDHKTGTRIWLILARTCPSFRQP